VFNTEIENDPWRTHKILSNWPETIPHEGKVV